MPLHTLASPDFTKQTQPFLDCRVYERHATELATSCQPVAARSDNDLTWPGTIRDISAGGLGVVLKRRFEPGSGLALELPAAHDCPADTLLVRVVHATRQDDGTWLMGCRFISQLSDEEVNRLVRQPGRVVEPESVVTNVTFRGTDGQGRVLVISVGRLAPKTAWPVTRGATVSIRVKGKGAAPVTVQIAVDSCRQQASGWLVQGQFLGAPDLQAIRTAGR